MKTKKLLKIVLTLCLVLSVMSMMVIGVSAVSCNDIVNGAVYPIGTEFSDAYPYNSVFIANNTDEYYFGCEILSPRFTLGSSYTDAFDESITSAYGWTAHVDYYGVVFTPCNSNPLESAVKLATMAQNTIIPGGTLIDCRNASYAGYIIGNGSQQAMSDSLTLPTDGMGNIGWEFTSEYGVATFTAANTTDLGEFFTYGGSTVSENWTFELNDDYTASKAVGLTSNADVTVNLNGYTLTVPGGATVFNVAAGKALTVNGGPTSSVMGKLVCSGGTAFYPNAEATLTVSNLEITGASYAMDSYIMDNYAVVSFDNIYIHNCHNGLNAAARMDLTVKNSTISDISDKGAYGWPNGPTDAKRVDMKFENCTITRCQTGIEMSHGNPTNDFSFITLKDTSVTDCTAYGINAVDAQVTLKGCVVITGSPKNLSFNVKTNNRVYVSECTTGSNVGFTVNNSSAFAGIVSNDTACTEEQADYFFLDNAANANALLVDGHLEFHQTMTGTVSVILDAANESVLTASYTGSVVGYSYQWYADNEAIADATNQTYAIQPSDIGKTLKVVLTGPDYYDGTVESTATNPVTESFLDAIYDAEYFASLTLNENIDVNFSMEMLGDGFDLKNLTVTVDGVINELKLDNGNVVGVLKSVAPYEMGKELHIVVSYNGVIIKDFNYSILNYCNAVYNAEGYGKDSKLGKLCTALINYGKWAEDYYNEVNSITAKASTVNAAEAINFNVENYFGSFVPADNGFTASETVTDAGAYLTLGSNITLNFRVFTAKELNKDNIAILNNLGEEINSDNITVEAIDGGYLIKVNNIGASKLSRTYTLTIDGVAENVFRIVYGVESYCYDVQDMTGSTYTATLKTLCKAIYNYAEAAQAYVTK